MATLEERVIKTISEATSVDASEISMNSRFVEDMNLDSMDTVELILALEEEFSAGGENIEISDEEAQEFKAVKDVVDHLQKISAG